MQYQSELKNKTVKHKRSQAMVMRFYWIKDREAQGQFKVKWTPGNNNDKADYFTKVHPARHHRIMRPHIFNREHKK